MLEHCIRECSHFVRTCSQLHCKPALSNERATRAQILSHMQFFQLISEICKFFPLSTSTACVAKCEKVTFERSGEESERENERLCCERLFFDLSYVPCLKRIRMCYLA